MGRKIKELEIQNEILHSTIQDVTNRALLYSERGNGLTKIIGVEKSTSP